MLDISPYYFYGVFPLITSAGIFPLIIFAGAYAIVTFWVFPLINSPHLLKEKDSGLFGFTINFPILSDSLP